MVDVVGAETRAHQFLEQVRLLIAALGGAEPRERIAVLVADLLQPARGELERLLPARFAEHLGPVPRIDDEVGRFLDARLADQRLGQAMRVVRVVEAVAPLHAQAVVVRRAVLAGDELDLVLGDVIGEQAADAAERAHAVHLLLYGLQPHAPCRHQRAGGAGLHALAAGDAGRFAHRVVEVEHRHRLIAAVGIADDVVHLDFAAGAHAARALDAGVEVYRDRRVRNIGLRLLSRREPGLADAQALRPAEHLVLARVLLLRHVGEQQLEHHLLRRQRARRVGGDLHAGAREAAA